MFSSVSMTGTGLIVFLLSFGLKSLEIDFDEGQLTELANAILLIAGFIATIWGQLRRKDLTLGLLRK